MGHNANLRSSCMWGLSMGQGAKIFFGLEPCWDTFKVVRDREGTRKRKKSGIDHSGLIFLGRGDAAMDGWQHEGERAQDTVGSEVQEMPHPLPCPLVSRPVAPMLWH